MNTYCLCYFKYPSVRWAMWVVQSKWGMMFRFCSVLKSVHVSKQIQSLKKKTNSKMQRKWYPYHIRILQIRMHKQLSCHMSDWHKQGIYKWGNGHQTHAKEPVSPNIQITENWNTKPVRFTLKLTTIKSSDNTCEEIRAEDSLLHGRCQPRLLFERRLGCACVCEITHALWP